jgi:hypothetical protein
VAAHGWPASGRGVGGVMNTLPPTTSKTMKAQAGDNRKGARVGAMRPPTVDPPARPIRRFGFRTETPYSYSEQQNLRSLERA